MTILAAEVKLYQAAEVSDDPTNGGLMGIIESVSNVSENIFPDVPQSERIAGSTKFRKMFVKVENPADETLFNTLIFLNQVTPGDDVITIFTTADPQVDTQTDILGSENHFGSGSLNATVLAAVTSIDVLVEDDTIDTVFRVGDTFRISDKATLGGPGNTEFKLIDTVGYVANLATITFLDPLANGYSSSDTFVGSGLPVGDIVGAFDSFVVTSSAGLYDEIGNPVVVDSEGGTNEAWTLTFTSATAYDAVGSVSGAVGSGTVSSDFSPNNPDFSQPYFTLASAGFSGTYVTSDTITFNTVPSAEAVWYKRTVPAGANAIAGNFIDTIINGENV